MKKIKVATVFTGIGSIEWALKKLNINHEIIFACDSGDVEIDINQEIELRKIKKMKTLKEQQDYVNELFSKINKKNYVEKTYVENYEINKENYHKDIRLLDGELYKGKVDLLVGGSPCQSFSIMGYKKGLEDARGTLFYDFARLVKEINPKVFIFENVANLLKHDKGNTWNIIRKIFESLNYKIYYKVLDAKDYGIPQTRRRIFVVGFKDKKINFEFPKAVNLIYSMQDFLIENCSIGNFKRDKNGKIVIIKEPGIVEDKHYLSAKVLKHVMSIGTKNYITKPEIDLKIARPLLATMHKMHRAAVDNYITSKKGVRRLTPRESLRLMGYDDDFKIIVSDTQMYKQAGNSVVVDVIMNLLKNIINSGGL